MEPASLNNTLSSEDSKLKERKNRHSVVDERSRSSSSSAEPSHYSSSFSSDSGSYTESSDDDGIDWKALKKELKSKEKSREAYKQSKQLLLENRERMWLQKTGKSHFIDFDNHQRSQLKKYFLALDNDGSGNIGVEELEEPLISLGLAESKEEVEAIVSSVDEDGSNEIEFNEFLGIIKNKPGSEKSPIYELFQGMITGSLEGVDRELPFRMVYVTYRRQKMLDALLCSEKDKREKDKKERGERIMAAYKKQLNSRRVVEKFRTTSLMKNGSTFSAADSNTARISSTRLKPKRTSGTDF
mmetsp:Transcript_62776/g.72050  ORF Transcript_62776/g.72050 Transcript_62776/m.72050 type:complete len:299 (+) Transcript_62776:66-962(+)